MKKYFLFPIMLIAIISCSKDETTSEIVTKTSEVLDFSSMSKMDEKVDEIYAIKAEMETKTVQTYTSKSSSSKNNPSNNSISTILRSYNLDRLSNINKLREKLNFVSIQSIADEINSLQLVNPEKANKLFIKHNEFLKKNKYNLTETIFENRTSEVINEKGDVLINGKPVNFKISDSNNTTSKFITSSGKQGSFYDADFRYIIAFSAGRQTHKDDFGRTFFRYWTRLNAIYRDPTTKMMTPCPTFFGTNSNSIAGFSQSGYNPLAGFEYTREYPSGTGSEISSVSSQKWTAYQVEGGHIQGLYQPLVGNEFFLYVDFDYDSDLLKK
ncbi:hypothetical protein [Flavobacterium piscis]|uniref:Uncharacterized protein n=1 Tax=Flavobacterium piscis TaxID=1114874 RepID=A0ABU1Y686_9FLAO|nr:hypothetical protein [Flavobacterium piscis]MDR7209742.1 hypothetical protein [Flavobacterium piscis]